MSTQYFITKAGNGHVHWGDREITLWYYGPGARRITEVVNLDRWDWQTVPMSEFSDSDDRWVATSSPRAVILLELLLTEKQREKAAERHRVEVGGPSPVTEHRL